MIDIKEHEELINSYSQEYWKPFLSFIWRIEGPKNFGEMKMDMFSDKAISLPYMVEEDLVEEFRLTLRQLKLMPVFNWTDWEKGNKVFKGELKTDVLSLFECCKMFTALIRSDRFIEGQLVGSFKSGLILSILKRIQQIISDHE